MWIELTIYVYLKKIKKEGVKNCLHNINDFSKGNLIINTVLHYVHITRKHKFSLKQHMPQWDNILLTAGVPIRCSLNMLKTR